MSQKKKGTTRRSADQNGGIPDRRDFEMDTRRTVLAHRFVETMAELGLRHFELLECGDDEQELRLALKRLIDLNRDAYREFTDYLAIGGGLLD